ncbi:Uridylate kinase isoform A [Senna tora]|uniref:UMP kinase n=1 Tax=Senna tora TaxID=362788 RepID=A0A834TDN3_9FABA|nr:Uridylate kinase isoform A [Senna tora]
MATEDYSLLDSPSHHSHSQSLLHPQSRHFPSSSSSSPTTGLPTSAHAADSANADYYAQTFHDDGDGDGEGSSDPNKSGGSGVLTPNSKRAVVADSANYYNKKLKTSATRSGGSAATATSGEPDSGTEATYRIDYRKDREEWSDTAIACLLDAYTEKLNQLNRGNLRGRDWEEVAEAVSERCAVVVGGGIDGKNKSFKSVEQCKNKIDNLKKRYKVELQRISNGNVATSNWHWFKKIEGIVGNSLTVKTMSDDEKGVAANSLSVTRRPKNRHTTTNVAVVNNQKPKPASNLKWHRVVFKISGSALAGNCQSIDPKVAMQIAREVTTACRLGVEVAIVVGGRNFFCGNSWVSATGLDRPMAYQIGMMATVMNSILLHSALEKLGIQARVQSAFSVPEVAEPYSRQRAIRHLEKGRVVIFGGVGAGTGNPLFTTDTAAALRASELNADAVLKGTNVNGVYDCHTSSDNVTLDHISFREIASRGVTSMDMMALAYCEENGIPVVVFNLLEPGNVSRALCGDQVGTLIDQTGSIG